MQINKIYAYSAYSVYNASKNNYQPQNKKHEKFYQINYYNIPFARVDKGMGRFYEVNKHRLPTTVKEFLSSVPDKLAFSPLDAHKKAYEKLNLAKTIEDIQNFFPEEELFIYLRELSKTQSGKGLLGLYRDFKEIYPNGILKNGEDLTVYIVKKLFGEAKLYDEINEDLEKDLDSDIKAAYKSKYSDNDYVSPILRELGIYSPDRDYVNSLKFTRQGYSDEFGLKISEAQQKYWNSLTEEQKFDILSKRLEGRDNWWNSLPYNDKLELVAGIDSDEDLYAKYKAYVKAKKRELTKDGSQQTIITPLERPKKKVKVGSKLEDRDVFALWFKKNIEKFYSGLSEKDKDSVHIKRARRLTQRWFEMSPEERTELINKMKSGREPARFVMIDAWNHSYELIKELSKFLKAQQIYKPVNMLYSSEEFSEFQSKVMTEFWANNRDLAKEFGKNIIKAQVRVEDAIQHGQFEDLKQEIMRNRADRIKMLEHERYMEEQRLQEAERAKQVQGKTAEKIETNDYKLDFKKAYRKNFDPENYFPQSYVDEMTDALLEAMSEDKIRKYTEELNGSSIILSEEMAKLLYEVESKVNALPRIYRIHNALSAALADELLSKGFDGKIFEKDANELVRIMNMYSSDCNNKKQQIDKKRIERLYNEYSKDLTNDEFAQIAYQYFVANGDDAESQQKFVEYMYLYGRSLLIAYSDKSAYPDEARLALSNKFMRDAKVFTNGSIEPLIKTIDDIKFDREITRVKYQIAKRFNFIPPEIMEIYNNELALILRMEKEMKDGLSIDEIRNTLGKKTTRLENNAPFISINKHNMSNDRKIKMLAMEQAIADELVEVVQNDSVYANTFEEMAIWVERLSMITPGQSTLALDKNNPDDKMILRKKPNISKIKAKYREYYRNMKECDDLYDNNGKINTDAIICTLNPDENMAARDELIEKRMEAYFGPVQTSVRYLKDGK